MTISDDDPGEATSDPGRTIAFQGRPGAYSHMACREAYPDMVALPCHSFEDAFMAVRDGQARYAMIPVDNSVAGRVADVHHSLPECRLQVVAEHFMRVNHHLLAVEGSSLEQIRVAESHVHAVGQCRDFLRARGIRANVVADTAGAAADVAAARDPSRAAIASRLAAQIYGLRILASDIEDAEHNTTRFLVFSREAEMPPPDAGPTVMTFIFAVRNVPAALYKALGGFATNGVNMVKLESYIDGSFTQAKFYVDIIGHPQDENVRLAMEELRFFARNVQILGVYPADPFRERVG